ncbi:MAG: hypothetical protein AAF557_17460 [Pseudomonadota bacterium]
MVLGIFKRRKPKALRRPTGLGPDGALLYDFIEDEIEAYRNQDQGKFWPRNHHKIRPVAPQATKILDPAHLEEFYVHWMRVNGDGPPGVGPEGWPAASAAARRIAKDVDDYGRGRMMVRFVLLILFGCDDEGDLPAGAVLDPTELSENMALLQQLRAYTSMPNQWDKAAQFAKFAHHAPRLLQILRYLGYRHDTRSIKEEYYDKTDLTFWGALLVCILDPETRDKVLADLLSDDTVLPQKEGQLDNLARLLEAVDTHITHRSPAFVASLQALTARHQQRLDGTEAAQFAQTLGLDFGQDKEWTIRIQLAEQGSGNKPLLVLEIYALATIGWSVLIKTDEGRYSQRQDHVTQNDLGLDKADSLLCLPDWLRGLSDPHGLRFDFDSADIRAGRKRSNIKSLKAWLQN